MMLPILASMLLWISASSAAIQSSIVGCDFNAIASHPGFNAVLYNYDHPQTTAYSDPAFYAGGFQTGNVAGTASGITNINFSIAGGREDVYGVEVDGSNFAMDYTGYFKPPTTGIYKFDLTQIDDGAMVFVGTAAYDCCKPGSMPQGSASTSLMFQYKAWNKQPDATSIWVYFEAGSYYPIRIVYVNVVSAGGIGLQVTPPNGSPLDVGSLVYQLENNEADVCKQTTVTHSYATATAYLKNQYDETIKFVPTETVIDGVTETVILEQVYYTKLASTITSVTYGGPVFTSTHFTNIVQDGTTLAAEVIVIGKPAMQTTTTSAYIIHTFTVTTQTVTTINGVPTTSDVVVVRVPHLQTTYINADVPGVKTTTSALTTTINNKPTVTSIVEIVGPTPSTSYIYYTGQKPTTYMTTKIYAEGVSYIAVVAKPRGTSVNSWNEAMWQTYTTTFETVVDGDYTSTEVVVINVPSVTTVYETGTDQQPHTTTATVVTTDHNIVRSYLEVTVFLPHPPTSITVGPVEQTYLTTNGVTYYVVEKNNFPTVTTFANVNKVYTTYTPVVNNDSTDWEYDVVYPQPTTKVSEWTGLYTQYITSTIHTDGTNIAGYEVIQKVPQYSTSISEWGGDAMKTVTGTRFTTNKLGVVATTTYKIVYRPSLSVDTTTWARPDTTTEFTYTTLFPSNGFPITTSIEIVHIPGTNIVKSWTTTTIPGPCTTSSTSTSSYTTTVNNTPTVIGVIYYHGPSAACFLPPPEATTVTITKPATDCASHTISSTTELTGQDGAVTTSVNILVETPPVACLNTATTTTVTKPATDCASHTTASTTEVTGQNGVVTTSVNILVETPPVACLNTATTTTVTKPATDCASHTTASTTEVTGQNGVVTTSVNILVETPPVACLNTATTTTVTKPATDCASHTTASTTEVTGQNGVVTTSVNILVETPPVACFKTPSSIAPNVVTSTSIASLPPSSLLSAPYPPPVGTATSVSSTLSSTASSSSAPYPPPVDTATSVSSTLSSTASSSSIPYLES